MLSKDYVIHTSRTFKKTLEAMTMYRNKDVEEL